MRIGGIRGRDGEAAIEVLHEAILEECVGGRDGGDALKSQRTATASWPSTTTIPLS